MSQANAAPKKSNFGAWVFITIVILAMLLALGVYYTSNTIKGIQATMTAVEIGTAAP